MSSIYTSNHVYVTMSNHILSICHTSFLYSSNHFNHYNQQRQWSYKALMPWKSQSVPSRSSANALSKCRCSKPSQSQKRLTKHQSANKHQDKVQDSLLVQSMVPPIQWKSVPQWRNCLQAKRPSMRKCSNKKTRSTNPWKNSKKDALLSISFAKTRMKR